MANIKRIGVLTSGGDAPGMNVAVRAIVRKAIDAGIEVYGIIGGYDGLINDKVKKLDAASVSNIINKGGTFLYSNRCLEFKTEEGMAKAIATCKKYKIDGIVAIGGDGTFRGATDLAIRGIPTIGVTGTIDNDITATDYTVGFDTAMNTVTELLDKLRDTCESHARCNVVEIMGRDCGQLALMAGIAGGAIDIYIPEIPSDESSVINNIMKAKENGKRGFVVAVSEGVFTTDENGTKIPYGEVLTKIIEDKTGVESRFVRLAHIVRGGDPTVRDRVTATKMGMHAVELLLEGKSNLVVIEEDGKIDSMDIVFALTVDKVYKKKMTIEEAKAKYNDEQIAELERIIEKRRAEIDELYAIAQTVCN